MKSVLKLIAFGSCCCSASSFAINEEPSGWRLSVGANFAETSTVIGTQTPFDGHDLDVSFEENLGLAKTKTIPRFDVGYRFAQRHRVTLSYTSLRRDSDKTVITEPFEVSWDDTTYEVQAGAQLSTRLDMDIWRLAYGYDFINTHDAVMGVSAGVHVIPLTLEMAGGMAVCVDGTCEERSDGFLSEELTAPLPNFGLYGLYYLTPKFSVFGHARYLAVEFDAADGSITDLSLMASYNINKNWAIAGGYNYLNVEGNWNTFNNGRKLELDFKGPSVSVEWLF